MSRSSIVPRPGHYIIQCTTKVGSVIKKLRFLQSRIPVQYTYFFIVGYSHDALDTTVQATCFLNFFKIYFNCFCRPCEQLLTAYEFHSGRMVVLSKRFRSISPMCTIICLFHVNGAVTEYNTTNVDEMSQRSGYDRRMPWMDAVVCTVTLLSQRGRARDASCLSVVSFISTIPGTPYFIVSYFGFRFTNAYNEILFCFLRPTPVD